MDIYLALVRFFHDGGPLMFFIAAVLAAGLAIAVERYLYLSRARRNNQRQWSNLVPLLNRGAFREAYNATRDSRHPIDEVMSCALNRLSTAKQRDDVELALEEAMMGVTPRLEKRTHYLATFANIATLLGLLGTIIGLIHAFNTVAGLDPATKADQLASSISVAMNTTAFGLVVAIPLLLVHAVLQTKTTEIIDGLEMAGVTFINLISTRPRAGQDT
ncbi:MAG TPA: MotA/TolQ/ExbB proton channel family protein [Gammaproteobacteria bacterium]|nr:MotA/TolQ/ExbB proton channel family protein [Gammaproteobacteria bacterium]